MAYSIKKHEADRLANVLVVLGWTIKKEEYDDTGVTMEIRREIPKEILIAAGELEKSLSKG